MKSMKKGNKWKQTEMGKRRKKKKGKWVLGHSNMFD